MLDMPSSSGLTDVSRRRQDSERKWIERAVQVRMNPAAAADLAFSHLVFTQISLPRRASGDRTYFTRCGDAWIRVDAGSVSVGGTEWKAGLPSGALARLAFAHLNTYVVRHKTTEIPIASSSSAWLRSLGCSTGSLHAARARAALVNLAACSIQIGWKDQTCRTTPIHMVSGWREISENNKRRRKRDLGEVAPDAWPISIKVSADYAHMLWSGQAVPLDQRVLLWLAHSALAIDIYTYLTFRLPRIPKGREILLPWSVIEDQFSAGSNRPKPDCRGSWRRAFRDQLDAVAAIYSGEAAVADEVGLRLSHHLPSVSPRVDKPVSGRVYQQHIVHVSE